MTANQRTALLLVLVGICGVFRRSADGAEPTPHLPVPGVLYFDDIGESAPVLSTRLESGVQVTPDARTVYDRIPAGRPVHVLGWGEQYCWVQGVGTRGQQVVGWVPTSNLTNLPPGDLARMRQKADRLIRRSGMVEEGRITIGMTMDQVTAAFGRPTETEYMESGTDTLIEWFYHEYRTRHVFRPSSYVGGLSGPGGYWSSQSLLEAVLVVTFSNGVVVQIDREVYDESYTNRERIERWNDLYGYRSRWSTGLVGFSGPLVEVPIQKFGPDRGQYRPNVENRDPVTRLNPGNRGPRIIEPQPGRSLLPADAINQGGLPSAPRPNNPRTVRPGGTGGGRIEQPATGPRTVKPGTPGGGRIERP